MQWYSKHAIILKNAIDGEKSPYEGAPVLPILYIFRKVPSTFFKKILKLWLTSNAETYHFQDIHGQMTKSVSNRPKMIHASPFLDHAFGDLQ